MRYRQSPYSAATQNKGFWATKLVSKYKIGLTEKKINLDDDYIKFLAFSEHLIEKSSSGIVAMITNNSFLDGVTHRMMRKSFLNNFNSIYIVDLGGDQKSGESQIDENVFDIMQGVSIALLIRNPKSKKSPKVFYKRMTGTRSEKYNALFKIGRSDADFVSLPFESPYYFFVPKDFSRAEWHDFFSVEDLFENRGIGAKTERDRISIHFHKTDIESVVFDFTNQDTTFLKLKYGLEKDSRDWTVAGAKADLIKHRDQNLYTPLQYKPFDVRWTYYTGTSRGFIGTPGKAISTHMRGSNLALMVNKKFVSDGFSHASITSFMFAHGIHYLGNRGQDYGFPLFLYPDEASLDQSIRLNFDPKLYTAIRKGAGMAAKAPPIDGDAVLTGAFRDATGEARADEVKVFDYIYAVLHCPAYRETYREFLKIDFPRIPFPRDPATFADLSIKGKALRRLHLMEDAAIGETPYPFQGDAPDDAGDSEVVKPVYDGGAVWLNKTQHFAGVPLAAWEFYIGGYQPAQKWLKDRKGRELSYDDILHYRKIIKILSETDRIMQTIEMELGE